MCLHRLVESSGEEAKQVQLSSTLSLTQMSMKSIIHRRDLLIQKNKELHSWKLSQKALKERTVFCRCSSHLIEWNEILKVHHNLRVVGPKPQLSSVGG